MVNYSNNKAYKETYNWPHPRKLRLAVRIQRPGLPPKWVTTARVRLGKSCLLFLAAQLETQAFLLIFKNFVYKKLCCVCVSSLFPKYSARDLFSQNMEKHTCFNQVSFPILLRLVISQVSKHILKCKLLLNLAVSARTHSSVVLLLLY